MFISSKDVNYKNFVFKRRNLCLPTRECRNGHVLKLKKSLYGLKQASKCWNQKINEFFICLEFKRSETDYCRYMKGSNGDVIYLLIYIDDIILLGPNLKGLDELRNFSGLEIVYEREKGILEINQKKYIEGILKIFNFENCKIWS